MAMKLYARNFLYCSVCIIFVIFLHSSVPSMSEYPAATNSFPKESHPWLRQRILAPKPQGLINGVVQGRAIYFSEIGVHSEFVSIHEGPAVNLRGQLQAKFGKDVFISVKTTHKYHATRVRDILDTWFRLDPEKIFFFTDKKDQEVEKTLGNHLIYTNCNESHKRWALCCKMGVEFDHFIQSEKSWFCHFDDDNYVNVPELIRLLNNYDPYKDWYLGRSSTGKPISIRDREQQNSTFSKRVSFMFATGGAGFCISRSLALKMVPFASKGKFIALCERIQLPDDVTIGFLIEHLLGQRLTAIDRFHSHFERMKWISLDTLHKQISLSAGSYNKNDSNVVPIEGLFTKDEDPQNFRSIHCHLFPDAHICLRIKRHSKNS